MITGQLEVNVITLHINNMLLTSVGIPHSFDGICEVLTDYFSYFPTAEYDALCSSGPGITSDGKGKMKNTPTKENVFVSKLHPNIPLHGIFL